MFKLVIAIMLIAGAIFADGYTKEVDDWKLNRLNRLKADDGWLTVVGLYWLKDGQNKFGTDPSNDVVFPKDRAPAFAGSFYLEKGKVRLEAPAKTGITEKGKPVTSMVLQSDENGNTDPTELNLGSLTFFVIERDDKVAIRLKDKESPARQKFTGLEYYPINPSFRVEAKYEPYNPPKQMPIVNVLGMVENTPSPGALVFNIDGKSYRLDTIQEPNEKDLFVIFGDKTNGKETYGAGRYLYAPHPVNGKSVVDFNKSYNPPCSFTHFATCPLPPPQNKLPIDIHAGEKKYHE